MGFRPSRGRQPGASVGGWDCFGRVRPCPFRIFDGRLRPQVRCEPRVVCLHLIRSLVALFSPPPPPLRPLSIPMRSTPSCGSAATRESSGRWIVPLHLTVSFSVMVQLRLFQKQWRDVDFPIERWMETPGTPWAHYVEARVHPFDLAGASYLPSPIMLVTDKLPSRVAPHGSAIGDMGLCRPPGSRRSSVRFSCSLGPSSTTRLLRYTTSPSFASFSLSRLYPLDL